MGFHSSTCFRVEHCLSTQQIGFGWFRTWQKLLNPLIAVLEVEASAPLLAPADVSSSSATTDLDAVDVLTLSSLRHLISIGPEGSILWCLSLRFYPAKQVFIFRLAGRMRHLSVGREGSISSCFSRRFCPAKQVFIFILVGRMLGTPTLLHRPLVMLLHCWMCTVGDLISTLYLAEVNNIMPPSSVRNSYS